MSAVAVTDTHALIWYALDRRGRLGRNALRIFERAARGEASIFVPALVLVEIFEAHHRGVVQLVGGPDAWVGALFRSGAFFPADLTPEIILAAESLYAIPERGDRLIAATALHLGFPLLTRDPEIGRAAPVETLW